VPTLPSRGAASAIARRRAAAPPRRRAAAPPRCRVPPPGPRLCVRSRRGAAAHTGVCRPRCPRPRRHFLTWTESSGSLRACARSGPAARALAAGARACESVCCAAALAGQRCGAHGRGREGLGRRRERERAREERDVSRRTPDAGRDPTRGESVAHGEAGAAREARAGERGQARLPGAPRGRARRTRSSGRVARTRRALASACGRDCEQRAGHLPRRAQRHRWRRPARRGLRWLTPVDSRSAL
jgi:hypothetical protein